MALENVDPTAILSYLEAKKAALENVIASWKAALALGALGPASDLPDDIGGSNPVSVELPAGALLNKSLPAAIKLYLSAVKKKQTIKDIASALKEGGVESTSASFETVVTGALNRLKRTGEVLRFKDGWGLTEFYPESLRARLLQEDKPASKKKIAKGAKTKRPKRIAAKAEPAKESASEPQPLKPEGLEWRIELLLQSDASKAYTAKEMAGALHLENPASVAMALGRLEAKKKVAKVAGGKYQAISGAKVHEMPKAI